MKSEATIGIAMLATRFPRPAGDIGNPASFPGPVIYETVAAATPDRVVRGDTRDLRRALLPDFVAAAERLVARGAGLVSTSCGFLSLFQDELAAAFPVPVVTSALCLVSTLARPVVLTIEAASLTPAHLAAVGAAPDTPVAGMDGTTFARSILADASTLDVAAARSEHVERARALAARVPDATDIVLECTNMGPYADPIAAATGLPVHSIVGLLTTRAASLAD